METIELIRDHMDETPTTGELRVEGEHFAWTLELPWRDNRHGVSCIPLGEYRVMLSLSTRFGRELPRLIGVPGRVGILIHAGNTDHDTSGCILLGTLKENDVLLQSRVALERFLEWFASCGNEAMLTVKMGEPNV